MKKEWVAVILLAVLLSGTLVNIWYLDRMITGLCDTVELARERSDAGDFEEAARLVSEAADKWVSADEYTHIVIRHTEIDGLTDDFFSLIGDLRSEDSGAAEGGYEKLLYHLASIATMEHVTFGSIF